MTIKLSALSSLTTLSTSWIRSYRTQSILIVRICAVTAVLVLLIIGDLFQRCTFGQESIADSLAAATERSGEKDAAFFALALKSIMRDFYLNQRVPSFEKADQKLELLRNRSIRVELGFPLEKFREFESLRRNFQQQLQQHPNNSAELKIREMQKQNVLNLLTPAQLARLEQLVYHVDIAFRGLDQSLIEGKLGASLDLYDNQKMSLFEKATALVKSSERQIKEINSNVYVTAVKLLDEKQQRIASDLLGPYFEYRDPTLEGRMAYVLDSQDGLKTEKDDTTISATQEKIRKLVAIRYLNSHSELVKLLNLRCVRDELEVTTDQYAIFRKLNEELSFPGGNNNIPGADLAIDELLRPNQMTRLKQISYYAEIAYLGLDKAITHGNFGRKLEVSELQIATLGAEVNRIVDEAQKKIREIRINTQENVLRELSSEQRAKARELLGDFFEYRDPSVVSSKENYLDSVVYEFERKLSK